jgi:hypothetical protein
MVFTKSNSLPWAPSGCLTTRTAPIAHPLRRALVVLANVRVERTGHDRPSENFLPGIVSLRIPCLKKLMRRSCSTGASSRHAADVAEDFRRCGQRSGSQAGAAGIWPSFVLKVMASRSRAAVRVCATRRVVGKEAGRPSAKSRLVLKGVSRFPAAARRPVTRVASCRHRAAGCPAGVTHRRSITLMTPSSCRETCTLGASSRAAGWVTTKLGSISPALIFSRSGLV